MNVNLHLKMAQLDLARQMETLDFIKCYIDTIAASGFNTLFLYVEWIIRTKSFDIGSEYGYNENEIKDIICYAKKQGIDVIPGLASLGHAELLLERDEFKDYAELRNDKSGRWGAKRQVDLCPSNDKVKEFLTNYFCDIAEIFESEYIHIGCDEVWDMNYCEKCQAKAKNFDGEQKLFLEHIKFCHEIVSQKLGKKTMIWDDMFELYKDILPELPKDIILVNWQYQRNIRGYQGHINNCIFFDQYKLYKELNLSYIVASADYNLSNITTTTKLSNNYKPMGGLVTVWEKKNAFMHKYIPLIITTGLLWSNQAKSERDAIKITCKKLFGIDDEIFVDAMNGYFQDISRQYYTNFNELSSYNFYGPDTLNLALTKLLFNNLNSYLTSCKDEFSSKILEAILADINEMLFSKRCKLHSFERLNNLEVTEDFSILDNDLDLITQKRLDLWKVFRPNISCEHIHSIAREWKNDINKFNDCANICGTIRVLFVLPDSYGVEFFTIKAIDIDNNEIIIANRAVLKENNDTLFEHCFFIDKNFKLSKVYIEATGHGGQGVAYISANLADGNYKTESIAKASGMISNVQNILSNDITFAYLGDMSVDNAFRNREVAFVKNILEVNMIKS